MRNQSLFLLACFFLAACSRNGVLDKPAGLVGKWKMVVAQDISGAWIETNASTLYVEFSTDGKMIITNGEHQTINNYTVTPDSLKIVGTGFEVTRMYNIEFNFLTIGGPCFEPCFETYKRVSGEF